MHVLIGLVKLEQPGTPKEVGQCMHGFDGKGDVCIFFPTCVLRRTTLGYLAKVNVSYSPYECMHIIQGMSCKNTVVQRFSFNISINLCLLKSTLVILEFLKMAIPPQSTADSLPG
jgi:hypothetical protein